MWGTSSASGDPLAAFDTIRVTTEDIQTHYHDLPPLSTIYLPEDMLSFPRNRYEENFGYPWYLYVDGQYAWKMRWAARAASRAWRRAIERGDITYAIPPRYRDPMPEGKDRQVLLEESLCLTVVDKALEINPWARKVRALYKVRSIHFEDWISCDLGRDEVTGWAADFVNTHLQQHFPNDTWLDDLREFAAEIAAHALNTVYELLYDSADSLEFHGPPFPMEFCEKWFPDKADVPPERFTPVLPPDTDEDFFSHENVDHLKDLLRDRFRDVDGAAREPGAEERRRIERWEDEWGSPEPPAQPRFPTLADYLRAKAKLEGETKGKSSSDEAEAEPGASRAAATPVAPDPDPEPSTAAAQVPQTPPRRAGFPSDVERGPQTSSSPLKTSSTESPGSGASRRTGMSGQQSASTALTSAGSPHSSMGKAPGGAPEESSPTAQPARPSYAQAAHGDDAKVAAGPSQPSGSKPAVATVVEQEEEDPGEWQESVSRRELRRRRKALGPQTWEAPPRKP